LVVRRTLGAAIMPRGVWMIQLVGVFWRCVQGVLVWRLKRPFALLVEFEDKRFSRIQETSLYGQREAAVSWTKAPAAVGMRRSAKEGLVESLVTTFMSFASSGCDFWRACTAFRPSSNMEAFM